MSIQKCAGSAKIVKIDQWQWIEKWSVAVAVEKSSFQGWPQKLELSEKEIHMEGKFT